MAATPSLPPPTPRPRPRPLPAPRPDPPSRPTGALPPSRPAETPPRPSVRARVEEGQVRRPAGGAWLTILVACLAGLLFNADGAAHIADTQPLGWQRDTARAAVAPFRVVSRALRLNRPRAWLASAVGAPDLRRAGEDPEPTPPPTTVPPGATTTTQPPITVRTPTADDPLRVYLTGDSFLADVGRGLSATIGKDERWEATTDAKPGTGLSRPEIIDWPKRIRSRLPNDAEVVVLGFGGNDAQDMLADGERVKVGEPEWEAEYQARIGQVLDVVERPGRTIVWVGMPAATPKNMEKARPAMNRAAQAEVENRPGARFLDTAGTLSGGDGEYKDFLPIDGKPTRVRAADGFHLSPAGATLLGRSLVRLIATVWPIDPPPSTSTSSTAPATTTSRGGSSTSRAPTSTTATRRTTTTTGP